MTSYAPLFAKMNHESWNPDLIYFDNTKVYPTCSYYVQQMFGTTDGHYYYGDVATIENGDKHQGASCVLNTEKGELYIKYVNAAGEAKNVNIDMSRFKSVQPQATITSISGQPWQQNYFDGEPIKPVTKDIKVSKKMTVTAEPFSCSVIRIKVK